VLSVGEPQSETHGIRDKAGFLNSFVNKMDRIGATFVERCTDDRSVSAHPLILQIPLGTEDRFIGVMDLIRLKGVVWDEHSLGADFREIFIPKEAQEEALLYRSKLIESLAELDGRLMEKYVNEEEISEGEMKEAIRKATLSMQLSRFCVVLLFETRDSTSHRRYRGLPPSPWISHPWKGRIHRREKPRNG
jgi:elongation factor G